MGRVSPRRLWAYDPRYMVSEIGSPWRLNMLPQVQVLGGLYPGDRGHENPGAGSVRLGHLKSVVLIPQTRVSEVGSPWKMWICDPKYAIWGRSPWRLWTPGAGSESGV